MTMSLVMTGYTDYTQPPISQMPKTGETIYLWCTIVAAVAFIGYAIYLAVTRRSVFPLLLPIAGVITVLLEGPADVMTNAVHAQEGQNNAFSVDGAPIPWGVVLTYATYSAALPLLLFDRMRAQSLTPKFWWKTYAWSLVAVAAVEQIPVHFGLWQYYGYQPFKIGEMPLSLIVANAACVVVPVVFLYKLYPVLTGWRQLLVLGIVPAGTVMGWFGASTVMMNALGTDTESNHVLVQIASLLTVGLSLLVTWMAVTIVHWKEPSPIDIPSSAELARGAGSLPAAP